jgi:hypothetical protein
MIRSNFRVDEELKVTKGAIGKNIESTIDIIYVLYAENGNLSCVMLLMFY